jgi:hypothetical protein
LAAEIMKEFGVAPAAIEAAFTIPLDMRDANATRDG